MQPVDCFVAAGTVCTGHRGVPLTTDDTSLVSPVTHLLLFLLLHNRSSGDPHARIYDFRPGADHSKPRILALPEEQRAENKDVTAAEWHPSGNSVVAGSFKGVIRVWHKDGEAMTGQLGWCVDGCVFVCWGLGCPLGCESLLCVCVGGGAQLLTEAVS